MTADVRKAMTDAAVKAAAAVNYVGAGTVEFIVDGSGELKSDGFWFMEMNTRLQVEHPVTEMITGLDLVEWQIRVARGESLPPQSEISLSGHAFEARLYAEDPANDFLPSVGKLDILSLPQTHRVDTGVQQGGEVSIFYDPMISKITVHAETRKEAIKELESQCRQIQVYPVKTNAQFLANCLSHSEFRNGHISTHLNPASLKQYISGHDRPEGHVIFVDGLAYLLGTTSGSSNEGIGGNSVIAPMPGKIIALQVNIGDSVKTGDPLIIMEAMKMEMALNAPRDGIVESVETGLDSLVADGDILITLVEES